MRRAVRRSPLDSLLADVRALAQLERQRTQLDVELARLERAIDEARDGVDGSVQRLSEVIKKDGDPRAAVGGALAADKLPQRILVYMQDHPGGLFTAPELARELEIEDLQQIRTTLARLAKKGLIRRTGVKGEYVL
jgi:hypothetical protein